MEASSECLAASISESLKCHPVPINWWRRAPGITGVPAERIRGRTTIGGMSTCPLPQGPPTRHQEWHPSRNRGERPIDTDARSAIRPGRQGRCARDTLVDQHAACPKRFAGIFSGSDSSPLAPNGERHPLAGRHRTALPAILAMMRHRKLALVLLRPARDAIARACRSSGGQDSSPSARVMCMSDRTNTASWSNPHSS